VRVSGCGRSQRSKDREANASENHAGKNYRDVRANARDSVGMIAVGGGGGVPRYLPSRFEKLAVAIEMEVAHTDANPGPDRSAPLAGSMEHVVDVDINSGGLDFRQVDEKSDLLVLVLLGRHSSPMIAWTCRESTARTRRETATGTRGKSTTGPRRQSTARARRETATGTCRESTARTRREPATGTCRESTTRARRKSATGTGGARPAGSGVTYAISQNGC
jgi:hypothetical protein